MLDLEKRLINKEFAQSIVNKTIKKNAKVITFRVQEGSENPPLPFSLSKLQSFANAKYSLGAKITLTGCQTLYEKQLYLL